MMILPAHLKFRFCSMQFKEKSSEQNLLHSDMREFFVGLSKISIKSKLSLYCTTGKWWLYIFLDCENQVPFLNNIMPSFRLNLLSFSLLLCKRSGLLFSHIHIYFAVITLSDLGAKVVYNLVLAAPATQNFHSLYKYRRTPSNRYY